MYVNETLKLRILHHSGQAKENILYLCEEVLHRQLKWNGNTWWCSALTHNFDLLVTSFYEFSIANHEFLGSMTSRKLSERKKFDFSDWSKIFWKIGIWDLEFVKPHAMKNSSYTTWKCRNFFTRHGFLSTIANTITNDLHCESVLISISIQNSTTFFLFIRTEALLFGHIMKIFLFSF